nr:FHIPEP family type III secretion protein [Endozoicomonas sp.]
ISQPKALVVAGGVLAVIGLAPGMPHVAFIVPGVLLMMLVYGHTTMVKRSLTERSRVDTANETVPGAGRTPGWQDIAPVDPIGLDIGYRVIGLLGSEREGAERPAEQQTQLAEQIRNLRQEMSQQFGFLLPMVHIRDNLELDPESYTIRLHNIEVDRFSVQIGQLLAIATDAARPLTEGRPVREPSYGLNALWIQPDVRESAIHSGYTVVDCATVITTHVGKVMEDHIHELIGFEETRGWLEHLRQSSPKLCEALVPDKLSMGVLMQLLKKLLLDRISIGDSPRIAVTLLEMTEQQSDLLMLLRQVRITLRRQIVEPLINRQALPWQLSVFTLSPELEKMLLMAREQASRDVLFSEETFAIEPQLSLQLQQNIPALITQASQQPVEPVLLVAYQLWPLLSRYARIATNRTLTVLTFQEIPDDLQVEIIGQLG